MTIETKVFQDLPETELLIGGWNANDVIIAIAQQLGVKIDRLQVPKEDALKVLEYITGKVDRDYGIDLDDILFGIEVELCNDPNDPLAVRDFKILEKYLKEPKKN